MAGRGIQAPVRDTECMKASRIALAVSLASLVTVVLSGCSGTTGGYAILDRPADSNDSVPSAVHDDEVDTMDLSTSRYVGENDGTQLWLGRGQDASTVCLLAYPNDESWVIGCAGPGRSTVDGSVAGRFVFQPDGYSTPEDSTAISDNVFFITKD